LIFDDFAASRRSARDARANMSAVKVTGPRSRTLDLGNGRPMTSRDAGKASGAKPGDALAAHSFLARIREWPGSPVHAVW
jgi:hypothetical protein